MCCFTFVVVVSEIMSLTACLAKEGMSDFCGSGGGGECDLV